MRRSLSVIAAMLALCAGCSGSSPGPDTVAETAAPTTTTVAAATTTGAAATGTTITIPLPSAAEFSDTVSGFCERRGDARIEMAFRGTVGSRHAVAGIPWVTFDVDAWFTDDLGTRIGLWAPGFGGGPGERWLIAASRYSVGSRASGDVFWCASSHESPEELSAWDERYGGRVTAGAGVPESPAAPEVLAEIDAAEATWRESAPASYTAAIGIYDRFAGPEVCGAGLVRVTVVDGRPTQARDLNLHCDVPLDRAPRIDDLFALARDAAGALDGGIGYDDDLGFITSFSAFDRSVERSMRVERFQAHAHPLATSPAEALEEARAAWDAAAVTSYTATVDVRCFCGFEGPVHVEVRDGVVVEPSGLPEWAEFTVPGIFDAIAAHLDADHLEVAFHPDLGYPVEVRIDPEANAVDEEIDYFILELAPAAARRP